MNNFWSSFEKQAMRRVSTVAIFHGDRMLMGKRRDTSSWTNPGGHLEAGEDPLDGAVREVKEETGIDLPYEDLYSVNSKTVTKPDGSKIKVYGFKVDLNSRPSTTLKHDPDQEVSSWRWVPTKGGIPSYVANNLHVPLNRNVLLDGLGLDAEQEKTAFWQGFSQRAYGGLSDLQQLNPVAQQVVQEVAKDRFVEESPLRKKLKSVKKGSARRQPSDLIPGGKADHKTDKDFPADKIREGAKVESEHTSSKAIAHEISRDHLQEDPLYYKKLKVIEKK